MLIVARTYTKYESNESILLLKKGFWRKYMLQKFNTSIVILCKFNFKSHKTKNN